MIAELMPRMEGELSSVLGVLATGRNQGRLEGFTINMTSLDDIFLEVRNLTLFTQNMFSGNQWRRDASIGNWRDRSSLG